MAASSQNESPPHAPFVTIGAGCFWCVEMEFGRLDGVLFTRAGYEGGTTQNPSYQDVCTGTTGHAEVVEIYYDPKTITMREIYDHFLRVGHDPTQLNGQGVDKGTQYRSVIFYQDNNQKKIAQEAIASAEAERVWPKPIVTTLEPQAHFWIAEDYHQNYYEAYELKHGVPHINAQLKRQKWARQKA